MMTSNGSATDHPVLAYITIGLLGWAAALWIGYSSAASAMNARVSVLETRIQELQRSIDETRIDVNTLLRHP